MEAKFFQNYSELDFEIRLWATSDRGWCDWMLCVAPVSLLSAGQTSLRSAHCHDRRGAAFLGGSYGLPRSNAAIISPPPFESGTLPICRYLTWASIVSGVNTLPALLSPFLHDLTNLPSSNRNGKSRQWQRSTAVYKYILGKLIFPLPLSKQYKLCCSSRISNACNKFFEMSVMLNWGFFFFFLRRFSFFHKRKNCPLQRMWISMFCLFYSVLSTVG